MLTIEVPSDVGAEVHHVIRVIFNDWLGLPSAQVAARRADCHISLDNAPGKVILRVPRGTEALRSRPHVIESHDAFVHQRVPDATSVGVIGHKPPNIAWADALSAVWHRTAGEQHTSLPFDLIGAASFMLIRREEAESPERDEHDRFPATASTAHRDGILERPIIDEYVEMLWAAMKRLWPHLERKPRTRTKYVTCDVDSPCQVDYRLRAIAKDIVHGGCRQAKGKAAGTRIAERLQARRGQCQADPHYAMFDWMMDVNERAGNRMTFFFLAGGRDPRDGRYRLHDPAIRNLMRRIHDRGHEIGLHPSYRTYRDANATIKEANTLRKVLASLGIPCDALGSRQHYLRWETPTTARNLEAAGIAYDSTLSYADRPGFRCGTSQDFQMFDIEEDRPMNLVQRPLILMDCSVLGSHYMGMEYNDETLEYMCTLKERALTNGGQFTLLWHNSYFHHPESKRFYKTLVQ